MASISCTRSAMLKRSLARSPAPGSPVSRRRPRARSSTGRISTPHSPVSSWRLPMKPPSGWLDALPDHRLLAEFSLWSADLGRLADDIARVDDFVDIYHIDVADGHFSPALLYFPDLTAVVRKATAKPLHVHLMTADAILLDQIT